MRERPGDAFGRLREFLDRSLFPVSPGQATRFKGWEAGLVILSLVALAAVLQLFRLGPSTALNSLWAEDGPVFLGGALTHGFFDAVTTPYAEYLVVTPRLIAELGTLVPLRDAPVVMNLATVILIAVSGLAVWFASAGHVRSPYLRGLLVALMVLSPVGTIEAVATPTNLAWYMAFAVFWLLFWRPRTTWGAGLGGALVLMTGISTPATLLFAPVALLRAISIRSRRDAIVVGSYALGAGIQLVAMANNTEAVPGDVWTTSILTTFLQRVVDGSVLGLDLSGEAWLEWGWPFLIAIVLAVATYLVAMLVRAPSSRLFAAIALLASVVTFLVSGYTRALGDVMVWHSGVYNDFAGRYAIVPALLLLSAILALLDSHYRSGKQRMPALGIAVAAVLLASIITSFDVRGAIDRDEAPWDESVRAAAARCEAKHLTEAPVAISPPGWAMKLSCGDLGSAD
ncbi:MAG TPA: hypothetical protein VG816_09780 [Solirubrobacterales bacterium]|nr:hypothetical protein [Solirubrobacterales bacterium]